MAGSVQQGKILDEAVDDLHNMYEAA